MEETNSSVTVICSTYNSAKWIEGYLESINNQLLAEFDIIFVDANSDDGSIDTILDYQFRPGINKSIIRCTEKVPIYEAWNKAIKAATTPYVININTDDRLFPAGLVTYLNYAQAYQTGDIFYGSCLIVDDKEHEKVVGIYDWPQYSHETLLNACICGPFPMLKRQSVINDGLFDPSFTISGDYEMWLRMSRAKRNFVKVREVIGSYFYNPEGMSTNRESEHWQEHVRQDTLIRQLYK